MIEPLPPILLASGSPRRRELLEQAGFRLTICVPDVVEEHRPGETPEQYVARNALEKAECVARTASLQGRVLLAADTIVVLGDDILEKPDGAAEALAMLRRLSGQTHRVLTGVCLIFEGERPNDVFVEATAVTFRNTDEAERVAYVATGEPLDKAGAYAIQGGAAPFIDHIEGAYSNVVGLPVETVVNRVR